jgi:hypothetical protein
MVGFGEASLWLSFQPKENPLLHCKSRKTYCDSYPVLVGRLPLIDEGKMGKQLYNKSADLGQPFFSLRPG